MSSDHKQPDNLPHTLPEPVEQGDLKKWHLAPMKDYAPPKLPPPNDGKPYHFRPITEPRTKLGIEELAGDWPGQEYVFKSGSVGPSERLAADYVGPQESLRMDQRIRDMHRAEGLRAARTNLLGCRYNSVQEQLHSTTLPPEVERVLFNLIALTNHHLSHLTVRQPLDYERQAEEAMAVLADELLTALEERTRKRIERQAEEDAKRMEHEKLVLPVIPLEDEALRKHTGAFVPKTEE